MEFQMTFTRLQGNLLPLNYQYALSSWIYKVMSSVDAEYTTRLHEKGYAIEGRRFKLFTFSQLQLRPFQIVDDRIEMLGTEAVLNVRFLVPRSMENFIKGLFVMQRFDLGDWKSRIQFEVKAVVTQPAPLLLPRLRYRCISPLCVSILPEDKQHAQYLSPIAKGYARQLFQNLLKKQQAYGLIIDYREDAYKQYCFKLFSEPKSRLITIKPGTSAAVKVRGYTFDFEVKMPINLHHIAYYAGFGEKNSMGFGCISLLPEKVKAHSSTLHKAKSRFHKSKASQ